MANTESSPDTLKKQQSMKKLVKSLFSMQSTAALLVLFAVAIAYATFIENRYGTATARILIYNALWLEILFFLLAVNLAGSLFVGNLLSKGRWPVALFHISFLVILAGAAITRTTGEEGTLHIREGLHTDTMVTEATYLAVSASKDRDTVQAIRKVLFSPYTTNRFQTGLEVGGIPLTIKNVSFIASAIETAVEDPAGGPILDIFAVNGDNAGFSFLLKPNEIRETDGLRFGFLVPGDSSGIRITEGNGHLWFTTSDTVFSAAMEEGEMQTLLPGIRHPLVAKTIYRTGSSGFALKQYFAKGKTVIRMGSDRQNSGNPDALRLVISTPNEQEEIYVYGKKGEVGTPTRLILHGLNVSVTYGSLTQQLPFVLRLNDFQIERYPGSNSPSSFASEVTLIRKEDSVELPYRIFMNNILKYKGYRLFQSSYDPDEQGTILSVNADRLGTAVTYTGYFLLTLGMLLTLFSRRSRFRKMADQLTRLSHGRKKLAGLLLLVAILFPAARSAGAGQAVFIPLEQAELFGTLLVQNSSGRVEPVNTVASEVLRKVSGKAGYKDLGPVQVALDMLVNPDKWKSEPLIRVTKPLRKKIPGSENGFLRLRDLLDEQTGIYLLHDAVEAAYAKKPAVRNKLDKEVINLDERVNVLISWMNGRYLTLFPVPDDPDNKWLSVPEAVQSDHEQVSRFASSVFSQYLGSLQEAMASGDYRKSSQVLSMMKQNQKNLGGKIYPSGIKVQLEIFYVNYNIFSILSKIYLFLGLVMLVLRFGRLFSYKERSWRIEGISFWLLAVLFILHSAGLGIRWYISGHAPWSNGYETLLYISWATCLAGLVLARRSSMMPAITTLLSGISLLVAGMSWMNPELTNLVPVLKSYWLIVHVAVITASYGFFAVAALAGLLSLVLMILRPYSHSERMSETLHELELIVGIAITTGLFMLTTGSFLGGVWANESWGRYWGWDPKETWAMVTILVYAFIAHMHKIPGFRGAFAVSVASLAGFASVLMTFFGVNYYLSGLHSYAGGEPAHLPKGLFIAVFLVLVIVFAAYLSSRKSDGNKDESLQDT